AISTSEIPKAAIRRKFIVLCVLSGLIAFIRSPLYKIFSRAEMLVFFRQKIKLGIPIESAPETFSQWNTGMPAQLSFYFTRVESVAEIVARTVFYKTNERVIIARSFFLNELNELMEQF